MRARGPYGSGVVADVEGGRYGDRTVAAGRAYGGRAYAGTLPAGYRGYNYYGRPYYGYGGAYYRPYGAFYYPVPPPWGYCCYHSSDLVGAVALTVVGMSLLYSDGVYYEETKVQGETQYKVVAPPTGATLPQTAVPADAATVTVAGTTYYYYGNVFYKAVPQGGTMGFVTVTKPAGVTSVAALPADVKPQEAGNVTYLVSGGKYYMPYLDAAGAETYIVVDKPKATAAAGRRPRHPDQGDRVVRSRRDGPDRPAGKRRQLDEQGRRSLPGQPRRRPAGRRAARGDQGDPGLRTRGAGHGRHRHGRSAVTGHRADRHRSGRARRPA